jgi:hypothetical protein
MARASEWAARVEAWRASGLELREFCEAQEYSAKSLQWWSSQLRRKGKLTPSGGKRVALARVVRTPSAVVVARPVPIIVQLERVRVEVPQGADHATLSAVFEALRVGGAR